MRWQAGRGWARWRRSCRAVLFAGTAVLAGCTVLPIEEARRIQARQGSAFDVAAYVSSAWRRLDAQVSQRAVAVQQLDSRSVDTLGPARGNRAGEGSPWTFLVTGEGTVGDVRREGPRTTVGVVTPAGNVVLQLGPVVSGTAIRDALPFIAFDDVSDQVSFAEVGLRLTERAVAPLRPVALRLRPGDRVRFVGAASVPSSGEPMIVTPVRLESLTVAGAPA